MIKFNTIRFKVSILYTTILALFIVAYSIVLYFTLAYNLYARVDEQLLRKAHKVKNIVDLHLNTTVINNALRQSSYGNRDYHSGVNIFWDNGFYLIDLDNDFINIIDSSGTSLLSSSNMDFHVLKVLESSFNFQQKQPVIKDLADNGVKLRAVNFPVKQDGEIKYFIQVATSLKPLIALMKTRLYYRLLPIPVFLFLGYFIGFVLVRRILKPVHEVTTTADNITYNDLGQRVTARHTDQELRSLVDAFNKMIIRLEKSFGYVREFSSQVAHELKTPLAIIRGELEFALRKPRDAEEYKRALSLSLEEVKRILCIIDDLLLLTRLDYKVNFLKFSNINFKQFLTDIYQQSLILSSEKKIKVELDLPDNDLYVFGDQLHLRRLFLNLIDNAVKFTPPGGSIKVSLRQQNSQWVQVLVSDTGCGIKQENLNKIFDKFFHTRHAKGGSEGSGLGLAIAKSIAQMHKGDVVVESAVGQGTTFIVSLPRKEVSKD
jgi:heavy metal sensor kinase